MFTVLKTTSEILMAGIAITAFSLLLYALSFNLRDRVARSFALIMVCVVVIFTAEAIGSTASSEFGISTWLRVQWVGIVFLPTAYLHFSDAVLATTGKPSRGKRRITIRLAYLGSVVFLLALPFSWLVGPLVIGDAPAPHLQPTVLTNFFVIFYATLMAMAWYNFIRAYRRTMTATSRRRLLYLAISALAPALGSFPVLPFGPGLVADHALLFWGLVLFNNLVVGTLIVVMAYSVAFFGVPWSDRVIKARLFKWIMRGPLTASLTLAVVTLVRRGGEVMGLSYTAFVPILMVGMILLCEHLITLFGPLAERWLFYGKEVQELEAVRRLEAQLLTRNDLTQFLEMVLAAVSDRAQAHGAYVVALGTSGSELVVRTGETRFDKSETEVVIPDAVLQNVPNLAEERVDFRWGDDLILPLMNGTPEKPELLGLLGVSGGAGRILDLEQKQSLERLADRAAMALRDRRVQQQVFAAMESISPQVDLVQRLRAAARYDREGLLAEEEVLPVDADLVQSVKDALTHYWGGPKLTGSPLMKLRIVEDATEDFEGNRANALRAILKKAIEQVKPEGERRFTGEWLLYNILEMKFLEGKKVREIAMRLAMSEADLYRKQRVAIEVVSKAIAEMEAQARKEPGDGGGTPGY